MHGERCPICEGRGLIYPGETAFICDRNTPQTTNAVPPSMPPPKKCHGCDGLGWVSVPDGLAPGWISHPCSGDDLPPYTLTSSETDNEFLFPAKNG